jgi:hypothetical protein
VYKVLKLKYAMLVWMNRIGILMKKIQDVGIKIVQNLKYLIQIYCQIKDAINALRFVCNAKKLNQANIVALKENA